MIPSREAATSWPPLGLKATSVMTSGPHVSSLWSQLVTCRVSYTYTCPSSAPVARYRMQGLRPGRHWCLVTSLSSSDHYHLCSPGVHTAWAVVFLDTILTWAPEVPHPDPVTQSRCDEEVIPRLGVGYGAAALMSWLMNYKCLSRYQIWKPFDLTSFCRIACVEREWHRANWRTT